MPNFAQVKLINLIKKLRQESKPIRIIVLKARQLGMSTISDALIYSLTAQREGINSLILTDDKDGSNYLLEVIKLFHEKNENHLKPTERKSNEKKLEFEGLHSQVLIDTAQNSRAGRKYTYHAAHLSEVAFFPPNKVKQTMAGLMQTIPELPETYVIAESTANGAYGYFYELWNNAINKKNEWTPLFLAWWENPEYEIKECENFIPTEEENDYREDVRYNTNITICDNKMLWRRNIIRNKLNGDTELFKQEYPAYAEQAFLVSGRLRFDAHTLKNLREKQSEPLSRQGYWEVYQNPIELVPYVMGVDVAEGLEHGDNSVCQILNAMTGEQVAKFRGKLEPEAFAQELIIWGRKYNNAHMAIERNNHGLTVITCVKDKHHNLYQQKSYGKHVEDYTKNLGWLTTATTKPYLIDNLAVALFEGMRVHSPDTIDELFRFVVHEDGKVSAEEGEHDDEVMALAIANQAIIEGTWKIELEKRKPGKYSVAWFDERFAKTDDFRSKYK